MNQYNDQAVVEKVEGRGTSDLNRGIHPQPVVVLHVFSVEEAIKLFNLGFIGMEKLLEIQTLLEYGLKVEPCKDTQGQVEKIVKKAIAGAIQEYFGYSPEQLKKRTRNREIAFIRHLSAWLYWKHTRLSLVQIAEIHFYSKDHTNTMYACSKINGYLTGDGNFKEKNIIKDFLSKYTFE